MKIQHYGDPCHLGGYKACTQLNLKSQTEGNESAKTSHCDYQIS